MRIYEAVTSFAYNGCIGGALMSAAARARTNTYDGGSLSIESFAEALPSLINQLRAEQREKDAQPTGRPSGKLSLDEPQRAAALEEQLIAVSLRASQDIALLKERLQRAEHRAAAAEEALRRAREPAATCLSPEKIEQLRTVLHEALGTLSRQAFSRID